MSPIVAGIIGLVGLLLLMVIGVPVSFSMALVGFIGFGYLVSFSGSLSALSIEIMNDFSSYTLTTVPMFVLMGCIAFEAGISGRLYDAGYTFFGKIRGGLAIATIAACAGFSAICGSTSATAAAMGKVALPQMKKYNYDDSLATGSVAAGGTLGILIPPSTILIIYGMMTEQSIGKLFIAGVLPGALLAVLFMITIAFICWRNPTLGPSGPGTTFRQKLSGLAGIIETMILFALVMGGLFGGWFTPTQAGSAGAAGVLVIALARRQITWRGFLNSAKDTVIVASMLMLLVVGALMFSHFIAVTKIPFILSDWITGLPVSPFIIIVIIVLIHFVGGCFMDSFALIVLTIPIFFPVVVALGFDPIWYGVMIVLFCEMGVITPPVGLNVYVIKGIAPDVSLQSIFKGVYPFVAALVVCTVLLMIFPIIVTYLPSFMSY